MSTPEPCLGLAGQSGLAERRARDCAGENTVPSSSDRISISHPSSKRVPHFCRHFSLDCNVILGFHGLESAGTDREPSAPLRVEPSCCSSNAELEIRRSLSRPAGLRLPSSQVVRHASSQRSSCVSTSPSDRRHLKATLVVYHTAAPSRTDPRRESPGNPGSPVTIQNSSSRPWVRELRVSEDLYWFDGPPPPGTEPISKSGRTAVHTGIGKERPTPLCRLPSAER